MSEDHSHWDHSTKHTLSLVMKESIQLPTLVMFVKSIPLKDPKVRYIPLQVNDMWGSHESMTCGVNGIYIYFCIFQWYRSNYSYNMPMRCYKTVTIKYITTIVITRNVKVLVLTFHYVTKADFYSCHKSCTQHHYWFSDFHSC
jgi:hypothetical protein